METYDLVDALLAHQGQRHFKSSQQTSETCLIRGKPHYGIFPFGGQWAFNAWGVRRGCPLPFYQSRASMMVSTRMVVAGLSGVSAP